MITVIDVGCATYGGDASIPYLVEEFHPDLLVGYDPSSAVETTVYDLDGTRVHTHHAAAWTHYGTVPFTDARSSGKVGAGRNVPCVDLLAEVRRYAKQGDVILKIDAEGSEYVLLPYLRDHDADLLLKLAWVEPHCQSCGNGGGHRPGCRDAESYDRYAKLEAEMRCEMHRWNR